MSFVCRRLVVGISLALAASPLVAQETKLPAGVTFVTTVEGVSEYKLANGLRVLLLPDASQPKVTVNCTIFVGSRHEGYGETGMAHLLEHMVFKGCPKFPDVPKALRDHGANFNGTTWVDRTNYFETMPATDDNLEFGIELEADRLVRSFIKREDLMSEFTVVRNEFESGENSPTRILSQRIAATAFEWHNYGKSTIGNKTDIERVPIDNLQAFYKKYYRPDNAMLIVAGKFDAAKALGLVSTHFGPLKNPATPIPTTYTEEPPQDGERIVTLRRVGTVGATGVAYHVPAGPHADFAAVEVLEDVLTAAPNGRVYKALVESKLATDVNGNVFAWHDPSLLEITATCEPAKTEAARDALVATLENLATNPVTAEEVERTKQKAALYRERALSNSQSFAVQISEWAGAGDWRLFFVHRDRTEKVTAADVNRVAKEYLIRSNRTIGVYVPTAGPERATVPAAPAVASLVENYKGRQAMAAGEAFDPTPENVEKRVKRGTAGDGVKYAALAKKTRGETVNLTLTLRFGNEESLKGQVTACDFVGPMLTRGTTTKTRQQIKDDFEKLNATVSITSTLGQMAVTIQAKKANLPAVLQLLGDVLRNPAFEAKEFDVLKRQQVESLEEGKTEPQVLASYALRRKLTAYPADDVRYAPTLTEAIDRTKAVTVEQVKELYIKQIGGTVGELAIVGDFDEGTAVAGVTAILKGWKSDTGFKRIQRLPQDTPGGTEKINTPDKANAVYLAALSMPLIDTDPDYPALSVGNYLLGAAPLASRLSNRVRGKDGLSYGVGSMVNASPVDKSGQFMIFAITNPKNMAKVDAAIAEEIAKFLKDGVSASELEDAKRAYIQSEKGQRASDAALARQLATSLFAGRTFEYYAEMEKKIESLQPGDVKRAFDKLVEQKKLLIIQAGDLESKEKK
ncbi:M16 family metallopeptidase [Limnoglobus roseus]|uniref:Insulinase family protein n=1 Tax=Limnoglobus roseus TaxID=2598579 RepID=A0A5C1ARM7_9BACT|nr:pitrilysin family protein [Limnoglobus roseus]QEL19518.1 insulinase family protein [Limnoglobus roseus]